MRAVSAKALYVLLLSTLLPLAGARQLHEITQGVAMVVWSYMIMLGSSDISSDCRL